MADQRSRPHLPALIAGTAFAITGSLGIASSFAAVDWGAAVSLSLLAGGAMTLAVFILRRASPSRSAPD